MKSNEENDKESKLSTAIDNIRVAGLFVVPFLEGFAIGWVILKIISHFTS